MVVKCDSKYLVKLLQKGNIDAFDSLFEIYSPKLFGFAQKYFKNESDSDELVQEVFVKVWENHKSLKSECSFKSYLFTIALNQIRKHFNKKAISLQYLKILQYSTEIEEIQSCQKNDYEEILNQINIIIDQMPPRRREIFIKSKLEVKSSKEIASELNISAGTVDNQVSEALRFIRYRLKTEIPSLLLLQFYLYAV